MWLQGIFLNSESHGTPTSSQSFTYLNMADKKGPWYKEDGQQDKGLTKDDLLAGRRISAKKDPRFPDYYKRPNGRCKL